ncbi:winged helix-turn-helix domain-containing protein [Hydrogenimonas thermophila]|nr:winged helix-turn-helix domain-containing protein [Hydrogenimonas thermophila]WOE69923.1 winged helix-turn-helix domain-containing protein [Hydrogenimonas thermophila]WOE72438.1 winged helix-turn-helix domain-containing protein [Hydrogenimonas thermophila]WOE72440.1 winged helix-turn-helix domain-containing protein [Hydrogenimonas thermophila]
MIDILENNFYFKTTTIGEPQLGKRGLYPSMTTNHTDYSEAFLYRNFLAYADGTNDLIDIANIINVSAYILIPIVKKFKNYGLIL